MKKFKIFYELFVNDPDPTGLDVIRLNEKGAAAPIFLVDLDPARCGFGGFIELHHIEEIIVAVGEAMGDTFGVLPVVSLDDKLLVLGEKIKVIDEIVVSTFKQIVVHSVSFLGYQVFLPSL